MIVRPRPHVQRGFSLTEVLVGMVIGLLTILAIMQVMTAFEGQKRTTSGTSDTQTNGSIALYTIQRMMQSAGFGLSTYSQTFRPLNCSPEPTTTVNGTTVGIFPIAITDGGTAPGASDTITVRGDLLPPSTASDVGQSFAGMPTTITQTPTGNTISVNNNLGCATGDLALTMQPNTYANPTCTLNNVTGTSGTTQVTLDNIAGINMGDGLTCLKNWTQLIYSVSTTNIGTLALTENGQTIAPGIVMLRAQYGLSSTAEDNAVTSWVSATGAWATPSTANYKLIKAVHIAVIARSGLLEKDIVSTACSSTTTANPTGVCAWAGSATNPAPTVDLSSDPNWQHYRYRVFDTVIPLRNSIWDGEANAL